MKKILLSFLFLVIAGSLLAQPMHYNYLTGAGNTFPFGQAAGKASNWLFPASSFNLPTPCPPGQEITKVYFRMYGTGTRTFTNLHIWMAQTTLTDLTSGAFYAGAHDTVFVKDTSLTSTGAGTWMGVQLQTPYPYDPTKALVLFVGQCGAPGSGLYILQTAAGGVKRVWSVGGCPFAPYAGGDGSIVGLGIDVQPAVPPLTVPEVLYYTFDETGGDSTENNAIPGRGFPWAPLVGTGQTIAGTGQWGNALNGTGTSSGTDYVNTGWATDIGTSSWTISLWLNNITTTFGYLFGDNTASSWRSFLNGAAGTNNIILRGGGMQDLIVKGIVPGPHVITFVYDSAAGQTRGYIDGVLDTIRSQTPLNINGTAPFKVGGYSTSAGLLGMIDEFRIWDKALSDAEVAAAWNHQFIISGITPVINMPDQFGLSQNYPNPFNPSTKIDYQIPNSGLVILKVYDVLGKEVATLINEVKQAGSYTVTFNASSLPSGTYFYRLEAGDYLNVKKMILLK